MVDGHSVSVTTFALKSGESTGRDVSSVHDDVEMRYMKCDETKVTAVDYSVI